MIRRFKIKFVLLLILIILLLITILNLSNSLTSLSRNVDDLHNQIRVMEIKHRNLNNVVAQHELRLDEVKNEEVTYIIQQETEQQENKLETNFTPQLWIITALTSIRAVGEFVLSPLIN